MHQAIASVNVTLNYKPGKLHIISSVLYSKKCMHLYGWMATHFHHKL